MSAATIFCLAMLFVFVVAFAGAIYFVARTARESEREDFESDLDELSRELAESRKARVADNRYIHELEVILAGAGLARPGRA